MAGAVVSLASGKPVDPKPVLAGSWRAIQRLTVEPASSHRLEQGTVEYCVFVIEGSGTARIGSRSVGLSQGTGLVLLRGTGADVTAGERGLEALVVAVNA
jgi:hypothetical protein